jgi:hypothetical protein
VAQLRKATWEHKLLVVRGQTNLEPKRGWELLQQLDPDSLKIDNTTFARAFYPKDALVVSPLKGGIIMLQSMIKC